MFEAAVNDLYASERYFRTYPQPGDGWSCNIARCTIANNIDYSLEWESGFTHYMGDWVRDERKLKLPMSWSCKQCGIQGVGNCGASYDCAGNCTANCSGPGNNQVVQYGNFECHYPGSRYLDQCLGGCSCGCTGYGGIDVGPITCYDYCNDGSPPCPEDPTSCVCFTNCSDPYAYETKVGERQSAWYGGDYAYKRKHHIKREGEWRFDYLETYTSTNIIQSKYRKCDGTMSSAHFTFDVQYAVDKYVAPLEGFPGTRTAGGDCLCYSDWKTREGPNVGQDVQGWVGGQQHILYYHPPRFNKNHGIGIRKNSNSGTCNATYSVRTPDPSTLEIKRNGIVLGTVSLAQTATQVQVALRALTSNCVDVFPHQLAPQGYVPGETCVAPVDVIGPTTITTTVTANLIKTGWRVGVAMPYEDFPGAIPKYEAHLHGDVDVAAATADDRPDPPDCDEWLRQAQGGLAPAPLYMNYVTTAGSLEDFSRGFECIIPKPPGCFVPSIGGEYPYSQTCADPVNWPVLYTGDYRVFYPYSRGGPGGTQWPQLITRQADPQSVPTAYFNCGCKNQGDMFWSVCPWNDPFGLYAPSWASPRPSENPNDAWNIQCPWNGLEDEKDRVRPIGSNSMSELLYEDFGACNYDCTIPNNEQPCLCNTQQCVAPGVVTDERTNMKLQDGCCNLVGNPPGCPRCDIGFCGGAAPYPSVCYAVNGCRPECENPCYDKVICCCGTFQVPWYRTMRSARFGGYAKTMGLRRKWSLTRVDT
jgi:hypothetical protein